MIESLAERARGRRPSPAPRSGRCHIPEVTARHYYGRNPPDDLYADGMTAPVTPPSPLAPEAALWQDRQKIAQAQAATAQAFVPTTALSASKDAVSTAAIQTGLGGVLTQYDAEYIAEDIATIVANFLPRPHRPEIRIITDLSALADLATCDLITAQIAHLRQTGRRVPRSEARPKMKIGQAAMTRSKRSARANLSALTSGASPGRTWRLHSSSSSYQYSGASRCPEQRGRPRPADRTHAAAAQLRGADSRRPAATADRHDRPIRPGGSGHEADGLTAAICDGAGRDRAGDLAGQGRRGVVVRLDTEIAKASDGTKIGRQKIAG